MRTVTRTVVASRRRLELETRDAKGVESVRQHDTAGGCQQSVERDRRSAVDFVVGHVGIALATSAAAWLHAVVFWVILKRRGDLTIDDRLARRLPRILVASAIMAAALWPLAHALDGLLAGSTAEAVAALALLVGAGLAVYAAAAQLLGAARLGELRAMIRRDVDTEAA